jgi:hypothetical protein
MELLLSLLGFFNFATLVLCIVELIVGCFEELRMRLELKVKVHHIENQKDNSSSMREDQNTENQGGEVEEAEEEEHLLSPWAATVALIVITISNNGNKNKTDERATHSSLRHNTVNASNQIVAWKGKMDLAIGVAIGSSLQIALFVTPFLVILGWIMNVDMTLHFHIFETMAFFISGLVVTFLIQDGKSNYLEGGLCLRLGRCRRQLPELDTWDRSV